jgi:hypothetical protein
MSQSKLPPSEPNIIEESIRALAKPAELYINLEQKIIVTNEDKVRLCLSEHLKKMQKKGGWIAPLGILIPIVLALIASNFKDFGLNATVWQAIFVIAGIAAFVWLVYSLVRARVSASVEDVINSLKFNALQLPSQTATSRNGQEIKEF